MGGERLGRGNQKMTKPYEGGEEIVSAAPARRAQHLSGLLVLCWRDPWECGHGLKGSDGGRKPVCLTGRTDWV